MTYFIGNAKLKNICYLKKLYFITSVEFDNGQNISLFNITFHPESGYP